MTLQEILRAKGTAVVTVRAEATLEEVVSILVEHNIGSLVVCEPGFATRDRRLVGIVTERDILRACARHRRPLAQFLVRDVMTTDVITGALDDSVESAMGTMTEHRIRHLPVVDQGVLRGIISIGDVVKTQHDQLTLENHFLKSYLRGE